MMVCTFGDREDVLKWRRDGLALRLVVEPDGRLGPLAGEFAGLPLTQARSAIVKALAAAGLLADSVPVRQVVGVHERCQTPVEFGIRPQWFIAVRENADRFRARAAEIEWIPPYMRRRLEDWIDGLNWDWNISRQRRYGVPFPVWFCTSCATPVLARLQDLPVDPLADSPPAASCPACGSALEADPDVMDTWMISSLTPQINDGWAAGFGDSGVGTDPALAPMSMRVQAFEIIRTWLFYTVVQSELLFGRVPWRTALISGWGLSEQGKKLSKRDLDPSEPAPVPADRNIVDRWVLSHLADAVAETTAAFEAHDYMQAYQAASRMFWSVYCDHYLEMIKDRLDESARWTLRESYRVLLGLFAPFAPFVAEHMYQQFYRDHEDAVSLHVTRWPVPDERWREDRSAVDQLAVILDATRALRSGLRLGNSARLSQLIVQAHSPAAEALLDQIAEPLRVAARADAVIRGAAGHSGPDATHPGPDATHPSGVEGITVGITV
jgi:valyl-tRNA synthetase